MTVTQTPPSPVQLSVGLPSPASLRSAGRTAAALSEPLVVMTTLVGCPYCDFVRNQYLIPLSAEGKVQAVQLDIRDRSSNLQGFDGANTTPAEQTRIWKARFAPTVLFLGPDGQELAERLVGVAVPDFYGEYLLGRLDQARSRLKK